MLQGVATVNFAAADLAAARAWYATLLGTPPYFERPGYVEFRIGPDEVELGIIDASFAPVVAAAGSGAVLYWAVADVAATLAHLLDAGATAVEPLTERGPGFVTASVTDPFGNLLGIMENVHFEAVHAAELAETDPMDDEETAA